MQHSKNTCLLEYICALLEDWLLLCINLREILGQSHEGKKKFWESPLGVQKTKQAVFAVLYP